MGRVLIIDADPDSMSLLAAQLGRGGHDPVPTHDAFTALRLTACSGLPDAVVLSGQAVTHDVLTQLLDVRIPPSRVLLLTPTMTSAAYEHGVARGARFLWTPTTTPELLDAIDKLLLAAASSIEKPLLS